MRHSLLQYILTYHLIYLKYVSCSFSHFLVYLPLTYHANGCRVILKSMHRAHVHLSKTRQTDRHCEI